MTIATNVAAVDSGIYLGAAGGLPLPPPAVSWRNSSRPEVVSFGGHHPTPRQRQNVGVQRSPLAREQHDASHQGLILLQ